MLSLDDIVVADMSVDHGSRKPRITIERVMDVVRLGSVLRSQSLGEVALGAARSIVPHAAPSCQPAPVDAATLPSRAAMQRARIRLDAGAMLCHRWLWSRVRGVAFRYLAYDASPQRGVEVFATVERAVTLLSNDNTGPVFAVCQRRLPLVTLGQGRTTLGDKLLAHVHQTMLEHGPRQDT